LERSPHLRLPARGLTSMNGRRSNRSHGRKSHTERGRARRTGPRPPLPHRQEPETHDRNQTRDLSVIFSRISVFVAKKHSRSILRKMIVECFFVTKTLTREKITAPEGARLPVGRKAGRPRPVWRSFSLWCGATSKRPRDVSRKAASSLFLLFHDPPCPSSPKYPNRTGTS
jgi:hypothetical protein